jgi:hypothetical protein
MNFHEVVLFPLHIVTDALLIYITDLKTNQITDPSCYCTTAFIKINEDRVSEIVILINLKFTFKIILFGFDLIYDSIISRKLPLP